MAVPDTTPARACLLTAPTKGRPRYHLMELPPDLVHLFERSNSSSGGSSSSSSSKEALEHECSRGKKRTRSEQRDNGDEERDGLHARNNRPTLCIKGRQNDEAVLCTDTHTYLVRQVTQSNSMLLCTLGGGGDDESAGQGTDLHGAGAVTVRDNIMQILEVVPVVARIGRLTTLLSDSAYAGEENDQERSGGGDTHRYTPQQVASVVQASAAELRDALRQAYVVEMDGYLRIMSHSYLTEALRVVLAHLERLAVSPQRVLLGAAVAALRDVSDMRREAAESLLTEWFGRTTEDQDDAVTTAKFVALDRKAIARFLGLQLLRTEAHATPMELSVFVRRWGDLLGATLADDVSIDLLQGNHLMWPAPPTQPSSLQPASIQYFASSELPIDVAQRFQRLFTVRAQWTAGDLTPFLQDVATDVKRRDALLLKFARISHVQVHMPETKQERRARLMSGKPHAPTQNVQLYSSRLRY